MNLPIPNSSFGCKATSQPSGQHKIMNDKNEYANFQEFIWLKGHISIK